MTPPIRPRTLAFALGANVGRPLDALGRAARRLSGVLEGARVSGVYVTPPEGGADQPDYLNAVVVGEAGLSPREALILAGSLEAEAGRERPHGGAPRSLDVDVIFVGGEVVDEPDLRVPHPRWRLRDFVVIPLLDVAPDLADPETGATVRDVADANGWGAGRFPTVAKPGSLLTVEAR